MHEPMSLSTLLLLFALNFESFLQTSATPVADAHLENAPIASSHSVADLQQVTYTNSSMVARSLVIVFKKDFGPSIPKGTRVVWTISQQVYSFDWGSTHGINSREIGGRGASTVYNLLDRNFTNQQDHQIDVQEQGEFVAYFPQRWSATFDGSWTERFDDYTSYIIGSLGVQGTIEGPRNSGFELTSDDDFSVAFPKVNVSIKDTSLN